MCSPNFSLCFSIVISTSIGLLIATSLFYSLLSLLLSPSSSSSRSLFSGSSWTPHSTLVDISRPSQDPWENVDYYYYFFRLRSSCKMVFGPGWRLFERGEFNTHRGDDSLCPSSIITKIHEFAIGTSQHGISGRNRSLSYSPIKCQVKTSG
jgi:hypothetical protein